MTAKRTREISAEEVRQWRQVKSPGIRVKTEADQGTYTDPNDPASDTSNAGVDDAPR